jgi:hypothetical protein
MFTQRPPLLVELKLREAKRGHLVSQSFTRRAQSGRMTVAKTWLPVSPSFSASLPPQCGEQRVILQPVGVSVAKLLKIAPVLASTLPKMGEGLPQPFFSKSPSRGKVHLAGGKSGRGR